MVRMMMMTMTTTMMMIGQICCDLKGHFQDPPLPGGVTQLLISHSPIQPFYHLTPAFLVTFHNFTGQGHFLNFHYFWRLRYIFLMVRSILHYTAVLVVVL